MNPETNVPDDSDQVPHKFQPHESQQQSVAADSSDSDSYHSNMNKPVVAPAPHSYSPHPRASETPASFSPTELPAKNRRWGIARFLGEAKAYLVEYALILISTGILLGVVIAMLNTILKYTQDSSGYYSSFAYTVSISMIATLIVIIPLVLLLTKRTNSVEEKDPDIKNEGWRKGFLGFFLLNVGLWGIGFSIAFVYDFVSYFASFGISDNNTFPWRSLVANGGATSILAFTLWLYSHDYRDQHRVKPSINKVHHYGLIGLAVLLTFIYMATAFKSQRASFIDDAISGDLSSIQSKVDTYKAEHQGLLPGSLNDMNLNEQQKARAKKYNYTYNTKASGYEVCAIFKTDTKSKDKGSQNPLEAFSGSSNAYDNYASDSSDPHMHGKGKQCFESKSYDTSDSYLQSRPQDGSSTYDQQSPSNETLTN